MKKILVIAMCGALVASFTACGDSSSESAAEREEAVVELEETAEEEDVAEENEDQGEAEEEIAIETEEVADAASEVGYEITYQTYQLRESDVNGLRCYAIVEVENTGTTNLELKSSPSFTFLDEEGNLAGVVSGIISRDPEIILPGERGYFYTNESGVNGDMDINGNYTFVPEISVEETTREPVNYELSDLSISEGPYGKSEVMGRVTNTTDEDAGVIWVAVVLFDQDDHPLAAYGTNVSDVAAGDTKTFDATASNIMSMDLSYDDIARYEVYACR